MGVSFVGTVPRTNIEPAQEPVRSNGTWSDPGTDICAGPIVVLVDGPLSGVVVGGNHFRCFHTIAACLEALGKGHQLCAT